MDRKTDGQADRWTDIQINRHRGRQMGRQTYGQKNRWSGRQTYGQKNRGSGRHTYGQKNRWSGIQTVSHAKRFLLHLLKFFFLN
jgi:hypothetical protein